MQQQPLSVDDVGNVWDTSGPQPVFVRGPSAAPAVPTAVALPVNPVRAAREAQEAARRDRSEGRANDAADRSAAAAARAAAASDRAAGADERTASNQGVDNAMKLRSAYESTPIVKEYRVGITQLGAALNRPADATGDNALIYDYAKAMDPGSVVRESEMGMAASGAPAYEAAAAKWRKEFNLEGGGQLTPALREKLKREIATKVGAMNKQYSAQRIRYAKDAEAFGIDPRNITGDHDGDVFMPQIKEYQDRQKGDNEVTGQDNSADTKPNMVAASGSSRFEEDPRASSMANSLMNTKGMGYASFNAAMKARGYPTVTPASFNAGKKWMKDTGKPYFGSGITKEVPLTTMQSLSGSPLGAGAARFANGATGGMVGAMSGEKGKGALDAMAAANPKSALFGDIAGGVLGAFGAEAGAAAALGGRGAAWLAPRLGDAAFGGLSGMNAAQEGEGAMGALTGAGAGVLGGVLGQGVANQAGRLVRGVRDPDVQMLRQQGVPLTVGQALGNTGRAGAAVQNVENALTSLPGVGGVVNARYREGLEGFNEAAMRQLPGHSGTTGAQGINEAGELVNDAYSFLDDAAMPIDAPFAGTQAALRDELPGLPGFGPQVGAGMDAIDTSASRLGGVLPGREWQSAVSNTRADRSSIAGQPFARPATNVLNDVEANLMGLAERQGPPGTTEALGGANVLNGQYQTLLRALDNGPAQQADELFTPSRLDAASRQGANAFGGRAASIGGDRPFYDLTTAGRSVLPSTVPDSGTATRGVVAAGVLGGLGGSAAGMPFGESGTGAGAGLGTALLLAAGGSRPAQRFLTSALLDRPDLAVELGTAMSRNSRYGGMLGTSLGVGLTPRTIGQ